MVTQEELSQNLITPFIPDTKKPLDNQRSKALQNTRRNDNIENLKVGIRDVDEAIIYYFNNVIRPVVTQNGKAINVPVMYANPEKWVAAQKQGDYRDRNGKRQLPVILFKRDSLSQNKNMPIKLDANRPHNFMVQSKRYSPRNSYSKFNILHGRSPEIEKYVVVVPDYVTLDYSCVLLTEYIEQTNNIIEAINFTNNSYWGDLEKFKFHTHIDSFKTEIQFSQGEDRTVKTNFSLKLRGYILADSINTNPYTDVVRRNITHTRYKVTEGVIKDLNI